MSGEPVCIEANDDNDDDRRNDLCQELIPGDNQEVETARVGAAGREAVSAGAGILVPVEPADRVEALEVGAVEVPEGVGNGDTKEKD